MFRGGYDIVQNQTVFLTDYTIYNLSTRKYVWYFLKIFRFKNTFRFEKSTDLPSPRCRSLVFATNHAIFCISGLVENHDENNNKKMKICTVNNKL
jgi:hypothetical protein